MGSALIKSRTRAPLETPALPALPGAHFPRRRYKSSGHSYDICVTPPPSGKPCDDAPFLTEAPLECVIQPQGKIRVQRDDLLNSIVSGNKWRKMSGWLRRADAADKSTLLTYGGAYSNHLVATACLAHAPGRKSIGILLSAEPMENSYLTAARRYGMKLCQGTRAAYRDKSFALADTGKLPTGKLPGMPTNCLVYAGKLPGKLFCLNHCRIPVPCGSTIAQRRAQRALEPKRPWSRRAEAHALIRDQHLKKPNVVCATGKAFQLQAQ